MLSHSIIQIRVNNVERHGEVSPKHPIKIKHLAWFIHKPKHTLVVQCIIENIVHLVSMYFVLYDNALEKRLIFVDRVYINVHNCNFSDMLISFITFYVGLHPFDSCATVIRSRVNWEITRCQLHNGDLHDSTEGENLNGKDSLPKCKSRACNNQKETS